MRHEIKLGPQADHMYFYMYLNRRCILWGFLSPNHSMLLSLAMADIPGSKLHLIWLDATDDGLPGAHCIHNPLIMSGSIPLVP